MRVCAFEAFCNRIPESRFDSVAIIFFCFFVHSNVPKLKITSYITHSTHKKPTHTQTWSRASITDVYALQCVHACNQNPHNLMIFCCCVSTCFTASNSIMPRSKSRLFRLSSAQSQRHWRRFAHSSTSPEVRAMKSTSARVTACRLSRGGLFQSNLNLRPNFQEIFLAFIFFY